MAIRRSNDAIMAGFAIDLPGIDLIQQR